MKPTISAIAKSTKDYPRPCRGSQLMGSQDIGHNDAWPRPTTFPPRLAGLVGCATGRKDSMGNDTREAGPTQLISEAAVAELKDALL
jgi:hypothetical protein